MFLVLEKLSLEMHLLFKMNIESVRNMTLELRKNTVLALYFHTPELDIKKPLTTPSARFSNMYLHIPLENLKKFHLKILSFGLRILQVDLLFVYSSVFYFSAKL